jgi:peptidoglycan/LPS O-acetylase OafA/YrhL
LYLAFLTFCFVIEPLVTGSQTGTYLLSFYEKLAFWLHFGNVVFAHKGYIPDSTLNVTWSLAVEEHFYLIWPAIAILCNRRTAMRTAAAIFIGTFLLRCVLIGLGTSPMAIYVLTPCRMDALAAGSWVALAARGPGGLAALRPAAGRTFAASTLTLAVVLVFLLVNRRTWFWSDTAFQTGGYTLLALAFAAGLVLLLTSRGRSLLVRCFEHPLPRTFGKYSYAIYLFHMPICQVFWMLGFGPTMKPIVLDSQIPTQLAFLGVVTTTTIAFAWLSWHLYEKPFLSLKRLFPATGNESIVRSPAVIPAEVETARPLAMLA